MVDNTAEFNQKGTELCICVTKNELKFYGNTQAFQSLSKWMLRNAKSDPNDYFELHVSWDMLNSYEDVTNDHPNIWFLFDKELHEKFNKGKDFECTFMTLPQDDLDKMKEYRKSGILPDNWGVL